MTVQQALYSKRRTALHEDLQALQKTLGLVKKELAMNEPLLAAGDISATDILRLQRQVAEVESQVISRGNKYFQDAQTELAQAEGELGSVMQTMSGRKDALDHTELRAPMAGTVKNVRVTTVGASLKPGEELLELVPAEDDLNEDIKPNEQPYYRAQVRISGRHFSSRPNEKIELQPGMTATAEIRTGTNTVLKYLTKPVIKTLSEAMRER